MTTLTDAQIRTIGNFDQDTIDNLIVDLESAVGNVDANRLLGRVSEGSGDAEQLTGTQATALLDVFTTLAKGLAPASGGGTTNFLRADGTWAEPPGSGGSLDWYNIVDHGLVAGAGSGSGNANRTAFRTLLNTVIAAGGGTIYVPSGVFDFNINSTVGDRTCFPLTNKGNMNIRLVGAGESSVFTFGGDSGSASSHLFQIGNNSHNFTVENMAFRQRDAITNPDGSEQHHLFNLVSSASGNGDVTGIRFINCHFGVVKGDGIACTGSNDTTGCHGAFAANSASGAIPGPYTSPSVPQRIAVVYPANWDGGSVTITGTDIAGNVISETIPALVGTSSTTYFGELYFASVTGASKSALGATAGNATIGYVYEVRDILIRDCTFNGFVFAGSDPGYGFRTCIAGQRATKNVRVLNCNFTGSDDQLIDMEPTGTPGLGPWIVDNCKFVSASPAGNPPPAPCVSIGGNGNVASQYQEYTTFTRNWVWGRLTCSKLNLCKITDNHFFADTNTASTDHMINCTDTTSDVEIARNTITMRSSLTAVIPIRVVQGSGFAGVGVFVRDNIVHWYGSTGIKVENSKHVEISGNHLVYLAATTATDEGIDTSNTVEAIVNEVIKDNIIEGDRGGGTLQRGINIGAGSSAGDDLTRIAIINNRGSGCVTGIRITNPSGGAVITTPAVVSLNDFQSATTPISAGGYLLLAGNNGSVKHLQGAGTPEGNIAAPVGSTYSRTDGGAGTSFYVKESGTTATGWAAK